MILECIKKSLLTAVVVIIATTSFAQITSGKIVFERKTNLKKLHKDNPRVKSFLKDDLTWKIDSFALYFNDTASAFMPIESDVKEEGFMKFLTTQNTIFKNYPKDEKLVIMNMWGTETVVKDTIKPRAWKVTENNRKIAGYNCRKAMLELNDTTRLYAWYCVDVVPSIGPEGFDGLPGAILGFANEEGSIIYFAKQVIAMTPKSVDMNPKIKIKETYTEAELKATLLEKMGQWVKKEDLEAMFSWL